MKERPILMSAPMVRAILDDRKSVTRRIVKHQDFVCDVSGGGEAPIWWPRKNGMLMPCPYGIPGNRLMVKEATWIWCEKRPNGTTKMGRPKFKYVPLSLDAIYCADHPKKPAANYSHPSHAWKYKPGRFMPRWASRLTLEITDVRVERLQDITEEQATAEGIERINNSPINPKDFTACWKDYTGSRPYWNSPIDSFHSLWESINGPGPWGTNPWVFAVNFKRVEA